MKYSGVIALVAGLRPDEVAAEFPTDRSRRELRSSVRAQVLLRLVTRP